MGSLLLPVHCFAVWALLFFLSGLLLGMAVDGNHIGASGLIYGLAAFLFVSGVIRDNRLLLRVSLAVAFLYGGIVWWMLPIDDHVSWEGHLSGALVGGLLAVVFRKQGPKDPVYVFERDEANDAPLPEWWMATPDHPDTLKQREKEAAPRTIQRRHAGHFYPKQTSPCLSAGPQSLERPA